jgi:hypothetical protein
VLDTDGDDDHDGVANVLDPAPLDRTVPHPPAPSQRPRVLVVGLDGAGWDVMDVLMRGGYLPAIGSLIGAGVRAPLDETQYGPTCCYCPPAWSSIGSGQPSRVHRMHLVTSEPWDRPVAGVWTALARRGGTSTLVAYRNTFPAEPGTTYGVSEIGLAAAAAVKFDVGVATAAPPADPSASDRLRYTWPPLLLEDLGILPATGPRLPVWLPFGADRVGADALVRLAETERTDLTMVTFHSVDRAEHVTWATVQPGVGDPLDEAALLAQAAAWTGPVLGLLSAGNVASQYLEAEQHLRRLLERASYDYVVFLSDHAMTRNPDTPLPGHHVTPPAFHGILALSGPGVRAGATLDAVSILDVAPTIAYLLDLPVAADLPGRVLAEAFTAEHLATHPIATVPTW